jgi:hypothetical protein
MTETSGAGRVDPLFGLMIRSTLVAAFAAGFPGCSKESPTPAAQSASTEDAGEKSDGGAPRGSCVDCGSTLIDVKLAWDAPKANEDGSLLTDLDGYRVKYGAEPGVYTTTLDTESTATTFTVPDVLTGKRYCFIVVAYDELNLESKPSNEVCAHID